MIVLSRKNRESVVIGGADGVHRLLKVTVLEIQEGNVRLGFEVDEEVPVQCSEERAKFCDDLKMGSPFENLSLTGSIA